MRDAYISGLCNPQKATYCRKEDCYKNGGDCRWTTNQKWIDVERTARYYQKEKRMNAKRERG